MSDILNPVELETKTVYCIGVKPATGGATQFMQTEYDHLTALKFINRMNCTKGLTTGDLYIIEEMSVTL